jgi:formate hydrogenlyase transcriptional activator
MSSSRDSLSSVRFPRNQAEATMLSVRPGPDSEIALRKLASKLRHSVELKTVQITLYASDCRPPLLHVLDPPQARMNEGFADRAEGSPARIVWQQERPLMISALNDATRFPEYVQWMRDVGLQRECVMPVRCTRGCLGAIGFGLVNDDQSDQRAFEASAVECATALNDILVREALWTRIELAHERDRAQLLREINHTLASHGDIQNLWAAVADTVKRIVPHEASGIALYNEQTSTFRRLVSVGRELFPEGSFPAQRSAEGFALQSGRALVLSLSNIDRFPSEILRRLRDEHALRSGCMLPLIYNGRKLGVVGIASRREAAFGPEELSMLDGLAAQVSIAVENALAHQEIEALKSRLRHQSEYLDQEISTACDFELIGNSQSFLRILKQVEQVAPTDATILIQGETGSGKELIARAIHQLSSRKEQPLVKVNCSAIPTGLLESEFFGHEKGSFTGAIARRMGRFELANQGTLFLDEVGDIPLELQPKLLRVLQEKEFERIGGTKTIQVDVRLVAATNADLSQLVEEKEFRSDLYYRLNVFSIELPPLRDRPADIIPLAQRFAQTFARRFKKPIELIPPDVQEALVRYHWPGNIRELQNVIERAVIVSQGSVLQVLLPEAPAHAKDTTLAATDREYIIRVLNETNWVISGRHGAANRLGLNRSTLQSKMRKLEIRRPAHHSLARSERRVP